MLGISTTIRLVDQMTAPIMSISNAINDLTQGFANVETASNIDTSSFEKMRHQVDTANFAAEQLNQTLLIVGDTIENMTSEQNSFNNSIRNGHAAADGLVGKIGAAATAYALIRKAEDVLELSDDLTQTTSRLNMMNDGLQTTQDLQNKIYFAAQRSRGEYMATADMVAKLGVLAEDAFSSNDDTIRFAEQLNKHFAISGTEGSNVVGVMRQITQALGSGVLRGDELNTVLENASSIAQPLAEYMGIGKGEIREMAAEGLITAEVFKNAMLAAAEETNSTFEQMPMTFGQIATSIKNQTLFMFMPLFEKLRDLANSSEFEVFVANVINVLAVVAGVVMEIFGFIMAIAQFAGDNWSWLGPIIWGVVGAMTAWKVITLVQAAVTWGVTAANLGLNAALNANPLMWIAALIGIVIMAIIAWINHVGGLRIAWLIVVNVMLTAWDALKIGFTMGVYLVMSIWDVLKLRIQSVGIEIVNFMGDMKTGVLTELQNMVNGAIGIINTFIALMNEIPGVSIDLIGQVSFGTEAQIANETAKQARNAALAEAKTETEAAIAERVENLLQMRSDAVAAVAERQAGIEDAKAAAAEKDAGTQGTNGDAYTNPYVDGLGGITDGVNNIDANTREQLEYSEEELKLWRDLAERESISLFTTAEVAVEFGDINNNVSSEMDLDGIADYIGEGVEETLFLVAEGVHI